MGACVALFLRQAFLRGSLTHIHAIACDPIGFNCEFNSTVGKQKKENRFNL